MMSPLGIDIETLEGMARKQLEADSSCHDWDHTLRVLKTAQRLGKEEGADLDVITVAALFHDIARPQEMASKGLADHAELGATTTLQLLTDNNVGTQEFRQHVCDCIRSHRWRRRNGDGPKSIEAKVLYDADKLDALGAIGLARAFHFAGQAGARVHNSKDEALNGAPYGREDTAYREFLVKQQYLAKDLLTASGRQLATQRTRFMESFFSQLNAEVTNAV